LRIALISTCAVEVPPRAYGGVEAFVAEHAAELVRRGHDVLVYAPGSSRPPGRLRSCFASPIWPPDYQRELAHCEWAWRDLRAQHPDVVHVNTPDALVASSRIDIPTVATLHHARADHLVEMIRTAPPARLVAISRRQAELVPELEINDVIHHGLDVTRFSAGLGQGGYAAFLGRFGTEKAPHLAIDAARLAGVPLQMGGPCWRGTGYDDYLDRELLPRMTAGGADVRWLGELDHPAKVALLRGASALLVPLGWEEPFGLVMIEAMLVGTPVIAFARGAAPEIVEPGLTGWLVDDVQAMAKRLRDADALDRALCRARALERWSVQRMTEAYEAVYREVAT
jgi:glycosyltransferase involved in cell wall biosynthesis